MKRILLSLLLAATLSSQAQENILPAAENTGATYITNAIIHVGNGQVIENGTIVIRNGKIEKVGKDIQVPGDAAITDAKGKHVYPGLILASSTLGLVEMSSIRATSDVREIGDINPNVRSIVAYNADSRIINTLRSNGVLLANVVPQGSLLAGSSSVVQLDAWNWDDAAYQTDAGMQLYMPNMLARFRGFGGGGPGGRGGGPNTGADPVQQGIERIENLKVFFREAKAYLGETKHEETNLKFEALRSLFDKKQKLYVHANTVKQILLALDFVKEFGFDMVIVGGSDSWQIADLLKQHNVSVILNSPHALPTAADDDVDQPYKTAALLQKAGVTFAISDDDSQTRGRNLAFIAGTAAAYGLTKEEALAAITLNAAKVLGVADKTGSIEVGKDANIVISEGDILDMKSNNVTDAWIQGRKIDLNDKHKMLYDRYSEKYKLKKGF